MGFCLCALTFIAFLSADKVDIRDIYGLPRQCVQGVFHYDRADDSLVFRRPIFPGNSEERVTIQLPPAEISGTFQVYYCWGQSTAIIGNEEVSVIIQQIERSVS